MNKSKFLFFILILIGLVVSVTLFLNTHNIAVLNPKGLIALKERKLLITATFLMFIVVIPVFIITFAFAWKYRANNTKAKYSPDWDRHKVAEFIWWGIPCVIILTLSIITWKKTEELDPYKPLGGNANPMVIQVVALEWKWLFIYPEQNIATVNFVQFPEQTPINFEITADAPMNSFWIPELGGQIYAMPGMRTKLHLIAHEKGVFRGSSANLSGRGFSGMVFMAKATSQEDFNGWVQTVKQSSQFLDLSEYHQLAKPSAYLPVSVYSLKEGSLFDQIVMKYMGKN